MYWRRTGWNVAVYMRKRFVQARIGSVDLVDCGNSRERDKWQCVFGSIATCHTAIIGLRGDGWHVETPTSV
jgi:hypothetical protein